MQKALRIAVLIMAVMLVVVLAVAPVSAAPALQGGGNGGSGSGGSGGSGNGAAGNNGNAGGNMAAGMNNWQTIMPGQTQEWVFQYTGSNDPANIELAMNPSNSVGFNVFTENQWTTGDIANPVGSGTTRTTKDTSTGNNVVMNGGDLFWSTAASGGSQRFHIQVYSRSQQPAQYWINATGAGAGSFTAFGANASNTNLQGQGANSSNSGANTSSNTGANRATTGSSTGTSSSTGTGTTRNTSGNNNNLPAPRTLPKTGGSDLALLFAAAAAALITGGWLARRRTN